MSIPLIQSTFPLTPYKFVVDSSQMTWTIVIRIIRRNFNVKLHAISKLLCQINERYTHACDNFLSLSPTGQVFLLYSPMLQVMETKTNDGATTLS